MIELYPPMLALHSLLRWAVLAAGLFVVLRALNGIRTRRAWAPGDDRASQAFVGLLDLQFLIGLALYFVLSPMTRIAFQDFGAAMGNSVLRFWAVEHLVGMLVGVTLAHIGRARIRRATDPAKRQTLAAVFFGLAMVAIVVAIPWPGTPAGRPLFRGF
jgi:hypothetical protein